MCVEENRREDADALEAAGLTIVALEIDTVADVIDELARLAAALDREVDLPVLPEPVPSDGRRAFVPIWRRPWMTIARDTYAASVLGWLGIDTVFAGGADRYPTVDWRRRRPATRTSSSPPMSRTRSPSATGQSSSRSHRRSSSTARTSSGGAPARPTRSAASPRCCPPDRGHLLRRRLSRREPG